MLARSHRLSHSGDSSSRDEVVSEKTIQSRGIVSRLTQQISHTTRTVGVRGTKTDRNGLSTKHRISIATQFEELYKPQLLRETQNSNVNIDYNANSNR